MPSLICQLQDRARFSPQENRLIDALFRHSQDVLSMNAFDLSKQADVSSSTLYRLCRKLGFDGFSDFKTSLASAWSETRLQDTPVDFDRPFSEQDDSAALVQKMGSLYRQSVDQTIRMLNLDELEAIARALRDARRVFLLTSSFNLSAAQTFDWRLREIGIHIHVVGELDQQRLTCASARENDLFLFVSYNGKMDHIVELLKEVSSRGARIALVTSTKPTPCRYYANMELSLCSEEDALVKISTFSSFTSITFVLDVLFGLLYQENYTRNLQERKRKYMVD
ncbi:MurR/RpiR family transcriptional regulator [uncultured Dubosiella sp.]|uniref:MurR/RpiR family transcriptional regulator n=1 Tax=uncultured Dubosiella sp. TaxID=1937011 RepID=UPI0025B52C4B|nr:MurR/RpiR family transcriptional regulator [uncultured Dubosiella sp.]